MLRRQISLALSQQTRSVKTKAGSLSAAHPFTFSEGTFETHNCPHPSMDTTATKEELLSLYKVMVEIRRLEMACDQAYKGKLIRGFCHLSIGQEAVAAGMEAAIQKNDSIITAYRCHGFTLTRGQSAMGIIAELMGRKTGTSLGKGGSMHLFANEFYGGNGIVGAQVPIGAGIALAHKYRNNNSMAFALYGDGAANQGQVFEAYNMAKLWSLPVAFVCENNNYGMGTAAARAAASTRYFARGDYIPGIRVDGMDVLAVREASKYAREWTLADKGPIVLEMVTYRYGGHSMSDPGTTYRTREEIQHMRSTRDPINGLKDKLVKNSIATEDELKQIEKAVRAEVDKAVADAVASPEPDLSELYTDIYAKGTEPPFIRGVTADLVSVNAYGRVGHLLSGAVANELLTLEGKAYVNKVISDYRGDLARATLWGDEIKGNHSYDWAKPLHYINPIHDDPPTTCAYNPGPEDCPDNVCVTQAIRNYTNRLVKGEGDQAEAFKFLIHFIGDLAQPLHATGRQLGGNRALARFEGRVTNLHAIWDYKMFEKRIKEDFGGSFDKYVKFLVKKIGVEWRGDVPEWLSCHANSAKLPSLLQIQQDDLWKVEEGDQDVNKLLCPEKWAKESNEVNCLNVWPNYKRKYELSGPYYRENILVEEKMLARAALRMASIIDFLGKL